VDLTPQSLTNDVTTAEQETTATTTAAGDDEARAATYYPKDILPIPKAPYIIQQNSKSLKRTSVVLTSSPCKRKLEESLLNQRKNKKPISNKTLPHGNNQPKKKKMCETVDPNQPCSSREARHRNNVLCLVCHSEWSHARGDWWQCVQCGGWACENCFGVDTCLNCIK